MNIKKKNWFKTIVFDHWDVLPRTKTTLDILNYIDAYEKQFKMDLKEIAPIFGVKDVLAEYCNFYNSPYLEIYGGKTIDYYINNPVFYQLAGFYSWHTLTGSKILGVYPKTYTYHFLNKKLGKNITLKHYMLSLSHELFHYKVHFPTEKILNLYGKPISEILTELRRFCFFGKNFRFFSDLEEIYKKKSRLSFNPLRLYPPTYFTGLLYFLSVFDIDEFPENIYYVEIFCEESNIIEKLNSLYLCLKKAFESTNAIIKDLKTIDSLKLKESFLDGYKKPWSKTRKEIEKKILFDLENISAIQNKKHYNFFDEAGLIFIWFITKNFVKKDYRIIFLNALSEKMDKYKSANRYFNFKNSFYYKIENNVFISEGMEAMNPKNSKMEQKKNKMVESLKKMVEKYPNSIDRSHYMGSLTGTDLCVGVSREEFAPLFKKENQWYREHGFTEEKIKIRAKKVIKSFNYGPDMYFEIFGEEPTEWEE